jgi:VIT1/CCC1 family predicted Fe2+/Mn2+ transporter
VTARHRRKHHEGFHAEVHHDHADVGGGWLRPAVFGAMDGLVSNVSLISGFAGGAAQPRTVLLAGLAGLASGAFSMATGEYVSVRSQNEAMWAEIEVERAELRSFPRAELAELAQVYRRRGVEAALADEVARQLSADPDTALRVHAQEELGVNPDELPSPLLASSSSFAAFAAGALVPVLPYLVGLGSFPAAAAMAAGALFGLGMLVSRYTRRSALYSGVRQLLLGSIAAAATYGVGLAVGTSVT